MPAKAKPTRFPKGKPWTNPTPSVALVADDPTYGSSDATPTTENKNSSADTAGGSSSPDISGYANIPP